MVRILSVGLIVSTIALVAWGVITGYDNFLSVGRMWQTPGIKPYENPIPVMAAGSMPVNGGEALFRSAAAEEIAAPFPLNETAAIASGKIAYQYYCIHCHGKNFDGYGTVGQSFAPPPGDLRSNRIQSMPEGVLFKEISYGIPGGRQPALDTTMAVEDRWHAIAYVKSLGQRQ
ncbi:c-type cytochrome [uncultured Desulfosarcina sp.]|uniref:c-type cytochrome n=1 Tax=uncultured Desulfosarcina sp. TaxID=218289 RepID=UPI0029C8AB5C|nr:c-type cytochrome [uncultured Desulfosarcina sp.]